MNEKLKSDHMNDLFRAILALRDIDECYRFFDDICTIAELKAISQRLQVAKMLRSRHVYNDIVEKTGASTATISRVNRCLSYGSDGYSLILERLEQEDAAANGKNGDV